MYISDAFGLSAADNWFVDAITQHIAICRDVVLERTIELRGLLPLLAAEEAHSESVLSELDTLQPLRASEGTTAGAAVPWSVFIGTDGPRPLQLLLEQPARLVRPNIDVFAELSTYRHGVLSSATENNGNLPGFLIERVFRNGTTVVLPEADQPFIPMRVRVEKLEALATRIEADPFPSPCPDPSTFPDQHLQMPDVGPSVNASIAASLRAICDHYREYVRLVCAADPASPRPMYTLADLLAREEPKNRDNGHYYIGGNATLGGAALNGRYFQVSQRMVALMTQQDSLGQRPKEVTSGSHPTYTSEGTPLFFKATKLGFEDSLGTTKEHAMYLLANKLFGRGIANTSLMTIARQTTVDVDHLSRRDHSELRDDVFTPDPDRFLNANVFDSDPSAFEKVKRMQRMHTRVLQVAEKMSGPTLEKVLSDQSVQLDPQSVSETVVLTILTTADDAKGDQFIVNRQTGAIVGIDNDHVLSNTLIPHEDQTNQYQVHFKNILLCCPDLLDAPVHPTVAEELLAVNMPQLLLEWLGELAQYEHRVDALHADGALPPADPPTAVVSSQMLARTMNLGFKLTLWRRACTSFGCACERSFTAVAHGLVRTGEWSIHP